MKPAVFILGASALPLARRLKAMLSELHAAGADIHGPTSMRGPDVGYTRATEHLCRLFSEGRPIVGICASGILIRSLAPMIADKRREPPVVAVAEDGSCAVPLLGGHHGANELAAQIAALCGGNAAITTAGDVTFGIALDQPPPGHWLANPQHVKNFTAALLRGEPVRISGTAGWLAELPQSPGSKRHIIVTEKVMTGDTSTLVYHPETLVVGIGCERGTDPEELNSLVQTTLSCHGLSEKSIACFATIDLKEDEPAITQFSRVPVRYFARDELKQYSAIVPTPSDVVAAEIGVASVAEAAALAGAGEGATLIVQKVKSRRSTCAIARASSVIRELRGRKAGKLDIVGVGPGDRMSRTGAAVTALQQAQDWVGYDLYLDLVSDLRTGQTEHRFPLGAEEHRVRHAIALARDGREVALVCSGDSSIYAMASLVFELLEREPNRIAVEVLSGVSAFQAASSRLGAIIGHDFCCISLSDLLTPWEVIERRIIAAAEGDFVVSFYNPRSRKRRHQLDRAMAILADRRPPHTPVIVASNLGRRDEHVSVLPLSDFDPGTVNMLTLVMVGSSQSRAFCRGDGKTYAYTPRGYSNKRATA